MRPRASFGLALALAACTGRIDGSGGRGPAGGGASTAGIGGGSATAGGAGGVASGVAGGVGGSTVAEGATPLRRLTPREYNNTVRDLLGLGSGAPPVLDETDTTNAGFSVSEQLVGQLLDAAEQLAARVDPLKLSPCDSKTLGEPACARQFTSDFGRRALRRPLTPDEASEYAALSADARTAGDDHPTGLRAVLTRLLIAPELLHHVEVGQAPGASPLSPPLTQFELAARLSYLAWETTPDDTLLADAAAGTLTGAEVGTQMQRLLADPRARDAAWHFHRQWLGLDALPSVHKSTDLYPDFDAARGDLLESVHR